MDLVTYHVRGALIDASSLKVMSGYSIVVETGVRDENSPLCMHGIKPGSRVTNVSGCFVAIFLTTGVSLTQADSAPVPHKLEVHIEFRPGEWRCRDVEVEPSKVLALASREVEIDLGEIAVSYDSCKKPKDENT